MRQCKWQHLCPYATIWVADNQSCQCLPQIPCLCRRLAVVVGVECAQFVMEAGIVKSVMGLEHIVVEGKPCLVIESVLRVAGQGDDKTTRNEDKPFFSTMIIINNHYENETLTYPDFVGSMPFL